MLELTHCELAGLNDATRIDVLNVTGNCTVYVGDCVESLRTMPDKSVHCCVTSPPYWGLRDYGVSGQLGLEKTPEEYVAKMVEVFREVRRVLKDDGTLWLNLGDSYAATTKQTGRNDNGQRASAPASWNCRYEYERTKIYTGGLLKPKDLVGIPWRVAFALQQPFYAGSICRVEDRVWLAAMLDAEGCMFIHKRKAGQNNGQGYERKNDSFSPGVEISNTSLSIIERIHKLVGKGSICSQSPDENNRRKQTIYRWNLRTNECRDFVRELYPHLVGKQQQARILCGCPSSGERAEAAHAALMALHRTGVSDVDFPAPPSMFEPGYYLRQDVIWSKRNPMPESVTDRCTKSHEYIFLMSKSAKYWYDAGAISEDALTAGKIGGFTPNSAIGMGVKPTGNMIAERGKAYVRPSTRNRRSVWHISTRPYKGAHFATFPPALIEPCIKAGCPEGGTVLDPFGGSGTTGRVASDLGRKAILCELNTSYIELIKQRLTEPAKPLKKRTRDRLARGVEGADQK